MSWRFRRSFKIIPGVRLNLSKTGLSASIGGAPFTLNVGPRGVFGTASLPGSGVSFRQKFGNAPDASHDYHTLNLTNPEPQPYTPPAASGAAPAPALAPVQEIRSASTELLTSESLQELKRLLQTAYEERGDIENQLEAVRHEKAKALDRFCSWNDGFLLKRIFKEGFAKRKCELDEADAKVEELEEQLRLTTVATQVEIEQEQAEPYFRMRDEFSALSECAAIWDIKSQRATDKFHERTVANRSVDRQRVQFFLASCDLINWEEKVPHLENANGGDLYLYPGFILYRATKEAFSVIDFHDVNGKCELVQFQEEQSVPSDSKVMGQTWAKANKDGSRDRRFADNHEIPIVAYASLTLKSESGLWEEFQFSNPERLVRFLEALNRFVASFPAQSAQSQESEQHS